MMAILAFAAIPFGVKFATLLLGASGYGSQSLYKIAQLAVPWYWRRRSGERGWNVLWPVAEPRPSLELLAAAVVVAVVFSCAAIALILVLAPVLQIDPVALRKDYDGRFHVSGAASVAVVVFLSFLNSALEELHFRAWLDRALSARIGNAWGITLSALAFGSMHGFILLGLPGVPQIIILPMIAGIALVGAAWSLLLRKRGGIYAAWLSHGLSDVIVLSWGLSWLGYL